MPDLGQTTAQGKILRWLKKPGEKVARGEALLEVETDKVTMEVEAYEAGYLRTLLVAEGEMAEAMSPIAVLSDEPGEDLEVSGANAAEGLADQQSRAGDLGLTPDTIPAGTATSIRATPGSRRPSASPAAKVLARDLGIDLRELTGTGPDLMIVRRDVYRAAGTHPSSRNALPMAAITAKSAAEIPHFYVTVDVDLTGLLAWRERWNAANADLHASVNDVFLRVASLALKDVPQLNTRFNGGKLEQKFAADILLVVAVESQLMLVPIADPASSTWEVFLKDMRVALENARQRRMNLTRGNSPLLAVSNLGMFGVKHFTAIIPPDCTAVLAIGAARDEVSIQDNQIKSARVCSLTLGSDHRVVDGITAARFLNRVQARLNSL
jgi:pyruvate dehydrogenase E2 component (dihydrolipoamide acetyltransferase)